MDKNKDLKAKLKEAKKANKQKAKKALDEYKKFAIKGNAIDLAIGVVLGSAFTSIVNAIVSSTITPLLSLLTSKVDLSTLYINLSGGTYETLEAAKAAGAVVWTYGELLNAILNFIIVSIVLFAVLSIIKKSTAKKDLKKKEDEEKTTKTCPYCLSTIPSKATKCAHCTSDVPFSEEKKENK